MKEGVNITAKVKMINSSQEQVIILQEYSVYISHLTIEIFSSISVSFQQPDVVNGKAGATHSVDPKPAALGKPEWWGDR